MPQPSTSDAGLAVRVLLSVFGFVFFGIGVTIIIFLWAAPFDSWGSPPLFFRVLGSFIALAFVGFGGVMCASGVLARGLLAGARLPSQLPADPSAVPAASASRYACSRCGAPLADGAEVSPHGDAKCSFCGCWFNIHGKRA